MRVFFLVIVAALLGTGCSKFAKVQKSTDYDYKLRMADQYFAKKKYNQAQQLYEELFPLLKGNDKFENVYYNFAYCAYYQRDYMNAENLFKGFTEVFPTSKRAEEMEYMRAYTYYKQSPKVELDQTNTSRTIGLMQTFINTHPGSERNKEATEIIDKCRAKLELKELRSAELYFNIRQYHAAAIAFTNLMNNFPDSEKSDEYKLHVIRSYFEYANLSVDEKKAERYEKVLEECNEFTDRFPDSKLKRDVDRYSSLAQNNIKAIKNEQVKTSA
ncbi:outer membrane protein assembly factor BamD [Flavihumibacter solisilvae]|jgi:outer membrane protein assembly factor BamD|uniref:Membrane protein n=1 Tax=Flavihumibacter solisilvae TaxID=1349421 RepID=A0A0C1KXK0_9BACT|nr:outer membrane protein assembly factor BamD [Flavihumibacter solisilvae]KIC91976.1 membrane protein [Flavihumibacter solisilvae]